MNDRQQVPPPVHANEIGDFLTFVNRHPQADAEACDAAADLDIMVNDGVLWGHSVYSAIFEDGPEADEVQVQVTTVTGGLGGWLIERIQHIRADLPALVESYVAQRKDDD